MDDLRVLVTYSSVHGSAAEIARAISLTLGRTGIDVDVIPASDIRDVRRYHAVILGSAVYGGRWRSDAVALLKRCAMDLFERDVWLFQSGPLGNSAQAIVRALPVDVSAYADYLRIKGAATFGGRLDAESGGPVAKFLVRAGFAGDYRDFTEIRLWAEDIARTTAIDVVARRSHNQRRVEARASR